MRYQDGPEIMLSEIIAVQCESSAKAYIAAVNKSKNQVTW
jgi:hypothetical protein